MTWLRWRRLRQIIQLLFFLFFVYLMFTTVQKLVASPLADVFFRFNPLSALASMLASRSWIQGLELALITVGVTILLGRVWCGWVCPMGTLLVWVSFKKARRRTVNISPRWRSLKYILLAVILAAAVFGNLSLLALDPIAILTRTATTSIIPGFDYGINTLESTLYPLRFLQPVLDGLETLVRGSLLPFKQPAYAQNLLIAGIFIGILALNLLADRFWCRYLCPLGGLLGLLSRFSIFRPIITESCNQCTRCALMCKPEAIRGSREEGVVEIVPSECTVCLDCLANCARKDMRFGLQPKLVPAPQHDLSRRQALGALGVGLGGVLLLRTDLRAKKRSPQLIRPPGVTDESAFLAACLRCSECMKICPTSGLQPSFEQSGLEGLWTPVLIPRVGYCDYGCNACGQVCPTKAIPELALEDKRQAVIGKANVNKNRCLPWASATPCIVCEEMCPTPQKSIRLEEAVVQDAQGNTVTVQRPYVLRELCIGCGICENRCPLEGEAGILVNTYSV